MEKLGNKFISFDILQHLEGESWKDLKERAYEAGYNNDGVNYLNNNNGYLTIWFDDTEKEISFLPSNVHDLAEALTENKARAKFYKKAKEALFNAYEAGKAQALEDMQDAQDYIDTVAHEYNSSRGV